MGAWDPLVTILKVAAVCLLLLVLGWAAAERSRVHRLAQERRASGVTSVVRIDSSSVTER